MGLLDKSIIKSLFLKCTYLIIFMNLSSCAMTHFKIKLDDSNEQAFSQNIISAENEVQTTPVEFALNYNDLSSKNTKSNNQNIADNTIFVQQSQLNSDLNTSQQTAFNGNSKLSKTTDILQQKNENKPLTQSQDSVVSNQQEELLKADSKKQALKDSKQSFASDTQKQKNENRELDDENSDLADHNLETENTLARKSYISSLKIQKNQSKKINRKIRIESNSQITKNSIGGIRGKENYIVKKGDTLMKISFAKYGNVYKWQKIFKANQQKISNFNQLRPGTELEIEGDTYVVIEKNGHPYLIRKNDTLLKISGQVYGDIKKWPLIWKNNKQLIHDPNKIYAGFTLYYLDLESMKLKKADFKNQEDSRKPTSEQ